MGRTSNAKDRLIETAMELMYTRGYTAVGVQEICARARVNKGSFYHFFPSKQVLVLAVIEAYRQRTRTLWKEVLTTDGSPLERLQRMFEYTYDNHWARMQASGRIHGCPIGNLALELSCHDETIRQQLHETFADWTEAIEDVLREAVTKGDLPSLDISMTAHMIVAYFEGLMMLAKTNNDPQVLTRLAQGIRNVVEAAACPYHKQ